MEGGGGEALHVTHAGGSPGAGTACCTAPTREGKEAGMAGMRTKGGREEEDEVPLLPGAGAPRSLDREIASRGHTEEISSV